MKLNSPVIDFHSHILPRVDHGCKSTEVSVSQLSLMREKETDIVVATSHFYPHVHTPDGFISKVDGAIQTLKDAQPQNAPKLFVGAEVLVCDNLCDMEGLEQLCIRGTKTLLLEMPLESGLEKHFETVESLLSDGYMVVLAHIDRYIKKHAKQIKYMLDMGALAQINADSLFSFGLRGQVLNVVKHTQSVCALGSDLHGADEKHYLKFASADKYLGKYAEEIMKRTAKLLDGAVQIEL